MQPTRCIPGAVDGTLKANATLVHDRDPLFTAEFLSTLAVTGIRSVKIPPRSPNLTERFVKSFKESGLDRLINKNAINLN